MKRLVKFVVLVLAALTVSSVSAHAQGTCNAPWNTFPFLYGTINITGSGTFVDSTGVTMTTDQHIAVGVKLESPPQCAWSAVNTGGAISYTATINDSQQQTGCPPSTWVASGSGQSTQQANATNAGTNEQRAVCCTSQGAPSLTQAGWRTRAGGGISVPANPRAQNSASLANRGKWCKVLPNFRKSGVKIRPELRFVSA